MKNSKNSLNECIRKLQGQTQDLQILDTFKLMYRKLSSGETGWLDWDKIQPLEQTDKEEVETLSNHYIPLGIQNAHRMGILKLNGGLGTTMGCLGSKSALSIRGKETFLEIISEQIQACRKNYLAPFPLILMNSKKTSQDAHQILDKKMPFIELIQTYFPRLERETHSPLQLSKTPEEEWAPPGHGEVLLMLWISNTAEKLIEEGITHLWISNADNLGPTFSPQIFGYMIENNLDFIVEATPKTSMDKKGGTFVRYQDKLTLLERSQIDPKHTTQFENLKAFPLFNTNNIWISLPALIKNFKEKLTLDLPLIVNPKKVAGKEIIQLEMALGSAISWFKKSKIIVVPRSRFLPVKTMRDYMIVASDGIIQDHQTQTLQWKNNSHSTYPQIELEENLETIDGFRENIKEIPSIKNLTSLKLKGKIQLGKGVKLNGDITIENQSEVPILIENVSLSNQHLKYK